MSRFKNTRTGVVVSVADDKDERFTDGWEPADADSTRKAAPKKQAAKAADKSE